MGELWMDLTLFAGEGGEGGGDGGGEGTQGAGAQVDPELDARRAEFDEYVKNNKDLYEEKLKAQLDRRMRKSTQDLENLRGENARYQNLARSIANRYGIDSGDLDAMAKAVDEDQSWLEEMAARNGLTVEQQKHMNALEAENQRFKAAREEAERQQRANDVLGRWQRDAEDLKNIYPDFNLESEMNNADFADLLGKGVPMKAAYQVVHMDDIMTQGMQYAVKNTASKVAASVRANGLRPSEGAGGSQGPTRIGMDVNKLTKEQREDLKRRAARGEEIGFG